MRQSREFQMMREHVRQSHVYKCLDVRKREFRVLELDAGAENDKIKTRLIHCSLDDPPVYEAVSYTWGSTTSTRAIQLGDENDFQVPINTEHALRDLRLADQNQLLWIDSICINQRNIHEKNYQVSQMRHIFALASKVRIWLDCTVDSQSPPYARLACLTSQSTTEALGDDPFFWEPLSNIANHPYWSRIWVQQELHLAKRAVLHCGKDILSIQSLNILEKLMDEIMDRAQKDDEIHKYVQWVHASVPKLKQYNITDFEGTRLNKIKNSRGQIYDGVLEALEDLQICDCTDPRDKVWACLGLIKDIETNPINVDYALSLNETYIKPIQALLEAGDLRFLSYILPDSSSDTKLASWVPDWRVHKRSMLNAASRNLPSRHLGGRFARFTCVNRVTFTLDGKSKLNVQGFRIDRVARVFGNTHEGIAENNSLTSEALLIPFQVLEEAEERRRSIIAKPESIRSDPRSIMIKPRSMKTKPWSIITKLRSIMTKLRLKVTKRWKPQQAEETPESGWKDYYINALINCMRLKTSTNFEVLPGPSIDEVIEGLRSFLIQEMPDPEAREDNERLWMEKLSLNGEESSWPLWYGHLFPCGVCLHEQRFIVSEGARIGVGPEQTSSGDEIWYIYGCPTPMILRNYNDDDDDRDGYRVIGPAYVNGCMERTEQEAPDDIPPSIWVNSELRTYFIDQIDLY